MARYVFHFTSSAVAGEEDAYNRWYEDVHMPDVLGFPEFLSGQRYQVIDPAAPTPRYIAAYEVECDDPHVTLSALFANGKNMVISPALDMASVSVIILKPGYAAK